MLAVPDYYAIEHIHSRFAFAPYCSSIMEKMTWNCKDVCGGDSNGTIIDNVVVDSAGEPFVQITHNNRLKSVYLGFRGAQTARLKWVSARIMLRRYTSSNGNLRRLRVHAGFRDLYEASRINFIKSLYSTAMKYPEYKIIFSGHSMGGAIAVLAALDFTELYGLGERTSVFTYGQPRVGNSKFCAYLEQQPFYPRYYRIVKQGDPVAAIPGISLGYADCGNIVEYKESNDTEFCKGTSDQDCGRARLAGSKIDDHDYYRRWIGNCNSQLQIY